ncbi:hypothetical protein GH714_037953 [Hevea brasiliensis]|uniref:Pectinesterase n=1 Tax=Hevea brasiliensis TaxID=3981 RepID=A0A6A6K8L3_HEVBR|nr:hypothetical protein GH714_037953 [Hevea brasiliensis]
MGMLHLMVFWLLGTALGASFSWGVPLNVNFQTRVQRECSFTRYPSLCQNTLMELKDHPLHIISALVNKTISETNLPSTYFQTLSSQLEIQDAQLAKSSTGVYKEKIRTNKDGITLIGDGKYSTIIAGDDSVAGGSSMPDSATFTITGDGFIARDIGFQNTAGPGGKQALALYIASDHSALYRCSIAGYQDTLYALALRQFYRECDIHGTVDFIFGNAAAVFQNCYLVLRRPHGGAYNVILAHGRTDPGQSTGFSIQNCRIAASSDFSPIKHSFNSYLGRPWKQYSRSVVMESSIDDAISSRGWVEWPGAGSYAKTLYFAEFSNTGPGAGTSRRVNWPGFHVIGVEEAVKFTVGNFIAGTSWLPSTE